MLFSRIEWSAFARKPIGAGSLCARYLVSTGTFFRVTPRNSQTVIGIILGAASKLLPRTDDRRVRQLYIGFVDHFKSKSPSNLAGLAPSIERQHRPGNFAGLHRPKSFVDVAEVAAPGHHGVEVEAALAVENQVERDVGAKAVGNPSARSAPCIPGGSPSTGTRSSRRAAAPRQSSRCRGSPGSRSPGGRAWRDRPPRKRDRPRARRSARAPP